MARVFAPLHDFRWPGHQFEIADDLVISDAKAPDVLAELPVQQGGLDWTAARHTRHWLQFECPDDSPVTPSEMVNLVLVSLWIVNPSQTQVRIRFQLTPRGNGVSRHLDRFQFINGKDYTDYTDEHLQRAAEMYRTLRAMYLAGGRLNHALLLTLTGCWSIAWSTALICHAAAAEGLLTYARGNITQRLSTVFACLTETKTPDRIAAYNHFRTLYNARSDIMHGRPFNIPEADRLAMVDAWQDAIRKLWIVICGSPALMTALQGSDNDRELYFDGVTTGFAPP